MSVIQKNMHLVYALLLIICMGAFVDAQAITLTDNTGGMFAGVVGVFNNIINFVSVPFAYFLIFVALALGIILWAWSPDNRALGMVLRAVIAGALIIGITALWAGITGG